MVRLAGWFTILVSVATCGAALALSRFPVVSGWSTSLRSAVFGPLSVLALVGPAVMLWWLSRPETPVGEADVAWGWRVSIANAAVRLVTLPVIADLWLYVLIGREFAAGRNAYYVHPSQETSLAYSVDPDGPYMTYGPLWAWLSSGLTALVGANPVVEAAAFKVLAAAAWGAMFWAVQRLARTSPLRVQLRALVCAGWLPVMLHDAVGDAHNDVLIAAGIALWLYLRSRESVWAAAPAVAATFIKYSTAPLLGLALVDALIRRRWREVGTTSLLAVVAASTALPLYEGPGMFDSLRQQASVTPLLSATAALHGLVVGGAHLGEPTFGLLVWCLRVAVLAAVLLEARRYLARPDEAALRRAALVLTTSVLLVWPVVAPWYFIWLAPLVAVAASNWASTLMLPPMLLVPLAEVAFLDGPLRRYLSYAAVGAYGAGVLLMLVSTWTSRRDEAQV